VRTCARAGQLATRVSHRNTGHQSGDPVCDRMLARIATDEGGGGLELAMVPSPAPQDTVVKDHGATVFLEDTAAQVLADKTLDVEPIPEQNSEGQLRFTIVPA